MTAEPLNYLVIFAIGLYSHFIAPAGNISIRYVCATSHPAFLNYEFDLKLKMLIYLEHFAHRFLSIKSVPVIVNVSRFAAARKYLIVVYLPDTYDRALEQ